MRKKQLDKPQKYYRNIHHANERIKYLEEELASIRKTLNAVADFVERLGTSNLPNKDKDDPSN